MTSAAPAPSAEEITRAAKSNLAFAFFALPADRRADINVFYAFCRVIDDLADEEGIDPAKRAAGLNAWRHALEGPQPDEPPLASAVRTLMSKYRLGSEYFLEIIAGCEMDILYGAGDQVLEGAELLRMEE